MTGLAGSLVALGMHCMLLQAPAPGWPTSAGTAPTLVRPAPTPADDMPQWLERRRRLRINFGVSAGVLGAGAATLVLGAVFGCDGAVLDCIPIAAIVGGVAVVAAAIPTLVYAVRLTVHNERRPRSTRMQLGPGGLLLRF